MSDIPKVVLDRLKDLKQRTVRTLKKLEARRLDSVYFLYFHDGPEEGPLLLAAEVDNLAQRMATVVALLKRHRATPTFVLKWRMAPQMRGKMTREDRGFGLFGVMLGGLTTAKVRLALRDEVSITRFYKEVGRALKSTVVEVANPKTIGLAPPPEKDLHDDAVAKGAEVGKHDWDEAAARVKPVYQEVREALGSDHAAFAAIKKLQVEAFALRKRDLAGAVDLLDRLLELAFEALARASGEGLEDSDPNEDVWAQKRDEAKEAWAAVRLVLGRGDPELDDLKAQQAAAMRAYRAGDTRAACDLLDGLVAAAEALVEKAATGESEEVDRRRWLAARDAARDLHAELVRLADGDGDLVSIVGGLKRGLALGKREKWAAGALQLENMLVEGALLRDAYLALGPVEDDEGRLDWQAVADALKLARRRSKPSWFWFVLEGADELPALVVEKTEASMRSRARSLRRVAARKKALSGWIEVDGDRNLVLWGEGPLLRTAVERAFAQRLPRIEELVSVAPLLRGAVFRDAAEAGVRPLDEFGPERDDSALLFEASAELLLERLARARTACHTLDAPDELRQMVDLAEGHLDDDDDDAAEWVLRNLEVRLDALAERAEVQSLVEGLGGGGAMAVDRVLLAWTRALVEMADGVHEFRHAVLTFPGIEHDPQYADIEAGLAEFASSVPEFDGRLPAALTALATATPQEVEAKTAEVQTVVDAHRTQIALVPELATFEDSMFGRFRMASAITDTLDGITAALAT